MKPEFVEILTCPKCGSPLALADGDPPGDIESGMLRCRRGHSFPIIGGIPRFVETELYVQNFGFEWTVHAGTQLDGASSDESEKAFREKTGFTPEMLSGKRVLDVGCGMGRYTDVASRWGATVVGIDLSRAVEAAQRNVGRRRNVHIAQANIFELPFQDETFDFIFSLGVLHHTPNTKAAFDNLPRLLRTNGRIAIWLYSNYERWRPSELYRRFTPRLPARLLHAMTYVAVPLFYVNKIPVVGRVTYWLLPISRHPKPEWRVLDTFDWYSPKYQWKHTYEEVLPWFEQQGLTDIRALDTPVAVQGTKN